MAKRPILEVKGSRRRRPGLRFEESSMTVHVPCLASSSRAPAMGTISLRLERPIISLFESDAIDRYSADFFFTPF